MVHGDANEKTAIGSALDGESFGGGVAFVDEVFAAGNEVIVCVLAANFGGGFVPGLAIFRSAADVGEAPDSAHVHPDGSGCAEPGGLGGTKSAVGVEEGGVVSGDFQVFAMDDVHRYLCSVGRGDEHLLGDVFGGVEGDFWFSVDLRSVSGGIVFVDRRGGCEVGVAVIGFVGVWGSGESGDGPESGEGDVFHWVACEVKGFDDGMGVLHVLDDDSGLSEGCSFDGFVAGGNDVGHCSAGEGHGDDFAGRGVLAGANEKSVIADGEGGVVGVVSVEDFVDSDGFAIVVDVPDAIVGGARFIAIDEEFLFGIVHCGVEERLGFCFIFVDQLIG